VVPRSRPEDLPRFIAPMLARSGPLPEREDRWVAEAKWDGCRLQVRFDGKRLCLRTRPGRDCTAEFPELDPLADALVGRRVVLDGELVCLDCGGRPDFAELRSRLGRYVSGEGAATLMVFDVLHLDGRAVRDRPYWQRREMLEAMELDGSSWKTPNAFPGQVAALARATAQQGLEGIVVKRVDAPYRAGKRDSAWIKHKHRRREEMLITAWLPGRGRREEAFALARSNPEGRHSGAGTVSLGLDREQRQRLRAALATAEIRLGRRRRSWRSVAPVARVVVDFHGDPDGPVRDPMMRDVILDADAP
jgi:bifunctional non-homologous end joining protein LigD